MKSYVEKIERDERHIKFLADAAGHFNPVSFLDDTLEDYKKYVDINEALFFITQAAAKNMKKNGSGAIINISPI